MRTVIRASSPVDLLGYAPFRLGFRPRESVVLIGMRPPRSSVGLVMRLDLDDVADENHGDEAVAHASELMAKNGSYDALVVLYTDLPTHELTAGSSVARAVERLRTRTDWCGAPGPWVVGEDAYGVWGRGGSCEPLTAPSSDLEYGSMAAALVLEGLTYVAEREDMGISPVPDPQRREAATRAYREARRRRIDEADEDLLAWQRRQYDRWHGAVARTRDGGPLGAAALGRLLASFEDVLLRDAAMTTALGPGPLHLPTMREINQRLALTMGPGGCPPGPEYLAPAVAVLEQAAGVAPEGAAVAPLGMLAWLAWWSGDGARADVLSEQCLATAPDYQLARLVRQAVVHHLPPGWVSEEVDDGPRAADPWIR